jgi:3-hydroxyisobutyrate dehydrogenase-like beta-hydroxyacid dehydrogenase
MAENIVFIGYGEAGQAFANARSNPRVFDIDPARTNLPTLDQAVNGATILFSLVTADQALIVAQAVACHMSGGTLYCDMNSVAPETKIRAATVIETAGGRYVDIAIMSPVNPKRLATPLLISGPHAEAAVEALREYGFPDVSSVGVEIGRASTIKMLRSVMYKGVEALTAECLMACEKAGVTDEVLSSFGNDWSSGADYRLDRMMVHGLRRSAEMAEVVKTLKGLGVEPLMTQGTVERQAQLGGLGVALPATGLKAKLEQISRIPFVSSEVETPSISQPIHGISTSLDANG